MKIWMNKFPWCNRSLKEIVQYSQIRLVMYAIMGKFWKRKAYISWEGGEIITLFDKYTNWGASKLVLQNAIKQTYHIQNWRHLFREYSGTLGVSQILPLIFISFIPGNANAIVVITKSSHLKFSKAQVVDDFCFVVKGFSLPPPLSFWQSQLA